jgi:hypothetical protein
MSGGPGTRVGVGAGDTVRFGDEVAVGIAVGDKEDCALGLAGPHAVTTRITASSATLMLALTPGPLFGYGVAKVGRRGARSTDRPFMSSQRWWH